MRERRKRRESEKSERGVREGGERREWEEV